MNKASWVIVLGVAGFIGYSATSSSRLASKIEIGMSKKEVIHKIENKRYTETKDLNLLCVINSWGGCKKALASSSNSFIRINLGIDSVLVIGFNDKGKVIFKTYGDT